jgi:hypothetical protein
MDSRYKMTISQTPSVGLAGGGSLRNSIFDRAVMSTEEFWNSRLYFPVMLGLAAMFLFSGQELLGMLVIGAAAAYIQFTCRDLMAGVLPGVLFLLLGTRYYDSLGVLAKNIWWIAIPYAASIVYNFTHWRIRLRINSSTKSLIAVAAASLIGGVGVISAKEYFSINGLYYCGLLGAGMAFASVLYGTNMARPRSYDLCSRFAAILYSIGIFTGLVVVNYYLRHFGELEPGSSVLYIQFRNYLTTMLVLAIPMPFRFVKKDRLHLLAAAFMYATLLLTGSRSGLVFGTVILCASAYLTIMQGRKLTRGSIALVAVFAAAAAVIIFSLGQTVLSSRLVDGKLFPVTDSRIMFLKQSVLDFLSSPINGIGIANMQNSKIFLGVPGSMVWYHNYFAQIIGSMGLIGVLAYGWLLRDRFRFLKDLHMSGETMLALGYIGILMVSMTNPGEFCPLPNEYLIVILFDVAAAVRVSRRSSTVSGETSSVEWMPNRRVKLGVYSVSAPRTVSVSEADVPVLAPQRSDEKFSPERDGIGIRQQRLDKDKFQGG